MKNILTFIILAFIVISCGDNGNNPNVDSSVLMPLKIGNKWEYVHYYYINEVPDTSSFSLSVNSEIVHNGIKYFQLKYHDYRYNNIDTTDELYINMNDGLYIYNGTSIFTKFKYPSEKGEILKVEYDSKFYVEDVNYQFDTPKGTFKCIKYVMISYYENKEIERSCLYYCPNIGLISYEIYFTNIGSTDSHLFEKAVLYNHFLK